ncbi:MAG TPA: hypothetical protein VMM58_13465 [Bacteroidota bacterium]|nr:hypothetical protein [Bacteroidota bacterium]
MRRVARWSIFIATLFLIESRLFAQTEAEHSTDEVAANDSLCHWTYDPDDSSRFHLSDFLPPLLKDESLLQRYIRDPRFQRLRMACGDTMAVDAIFATAYEIADGTMSHALLIATLATFDHFRLGLEIPLLGTLNLPLTLEPRSTFNRRYTHLPRRILPDSAGRKRQDRDKMQHFFGSAYLTYIFNSKIIAGAVGNFVEWGEPRFVVGGDYDERDKYANRLGQEFGIRLLEGEEVLPSDVLWGKKK